MLQSQLQISTIFTEDVDVNTMICNVNKGCLL